MAARKGFIWLTEWTEMTDDLDDLRLGRLIRALQRYDADGTEADFSYDGELRMAFKFIRNAFDRQADFYDDLSKKRSEAGKKHSGNQYTKKADEENGTKNGTNLEQNGTNLEQNGTNGTNGTNGSNININPNPNPNINPTTLSGGDAHAHTPTPAREGDEDNFDPSEKFGPLHNVRLAPAQHRHLVETYGEAATNDIIDDLSCKLAEGSVNSENHYATALVWLNYQRRNGSGRVPLSSTQAVPEAERIKTIKDYWQRLTPEEQQQHLDTHGGKYPWEDEQYLKP